MRLLTIATLPFWWLVFTSDLYAYFPINCHSRHAQKDFTHSSHVIIGRVTKIERYRSDANVDGRHTRFDYLATITVGRSLRGPAAKDDEMIVRVGWDDHTNDDNVQPHGVWVANSHPPWRLEIGKVYLLCLVGESRYTPYIAARRDGKKWKTIDLSQRVFVPRSCHWSIYELYDETPVEDDMASKTISIRQIGYRRDEKGKGEPLASFLLDKTDELNRPDVDDDFPVE